ncbi:MAG: hypothetical protein ABI134_06070 [Byssovorax sp.]
MTVIQDMSPDVLRRSHRGVAEALTALPAADPEALFHHWLGAGERTNASRYAVVAADAAADALAFVRAAELYRDALALDVEDTERIRTLNIKQADALVNAGRCAAAAPLYLAAASTTMDQLGLELRRRSAEQFLVSGHIDRGVQVLRPLLAQLGLAYPSSRGALSSILVRLAELWLRGLDFRERADAEIDREELLRIDVCQSVAQGLAAVDSIRGAHFALLTLRLALDAGEAGRICRSMTMVVATVLAPTGGRMARWGRQMLDVARDLADRRDDPNLRGAVLSAFGQAAIFTGDWRDALASCDAAVACFRAHRRGGAWECTVGQMGALRAVEELGRLSEFASRAEDLFRDAERRGDLYGRMTAHVYRPIARLASGDPAGARAEVDGALRIWKTGGFSVQHLYALRIQVYCDMYEGDAGAAWERLERGWAALKASNLLRVPIIRIDARLLRARTTLGLASASPGQRRRDLLQLCERRARELAGEAQAHVAAHVALLRAGIATLRGQRARALTGLNEALVRYEREGMALSSAYVTHRRGSLIGDGEGRTLQADAASQMAAEGVVNPARWLAIHAPGFPA